MGHDSDMWEMAWICGERFKSVGSSLDMWENGLSMWEIAEINWKRLKIEICEKLMCVKRLSL